MKNPVRALVVWQPWATLIAVGAKRIETRGWSTNHRGPLVIYAAAKWTRWQWELLAEPAIRRALDAAGFDPPSAWCGANRTRPLRLGEPVAVVDLADVRRIVEGPSLVAGSYLSTPVPGPEVPLGDYTPGRFAWMLQDPRPVDLGARPAVAGRQGLFTPPAEVLDAILGRVA